MANFSFKTNSLKDVVAKQPEFYLEGFLPIPRCAVTMLASVGGLGKSLLCIQIAIRMAKQNNKVLLWLSEDSEAISKFRAIEISKYIPDCKSDLSNIDICDEMPIHLEDKNFDKFKSSFKQYDLIILDCLIAFYGGDENNNSEARYFMNLLNKIVKENSQSIVVVHHSTKPNMNGESKSRGASAFKDATRLTYELKLPKSNDKYMSMRELFIDKDNYGVKNIIGSDTLSIKVIPNKLSKIVVNNNIDIDESDEPTENNEILTKLERQYEFN